MVKGDQQEEEEEQEQELEEKQELKEALLSRENWMGCRRRSRRSRRSMSRVAFLLEPAPSPDNCFAFCQKFKLLGPVGDDQASSSCVAWSPFKRFIVALVASK